MAEAFVSLATNNDYGSGAYVLGKSLKNTNTTKRLALMVTNGISEAQRVHLNEVWDELIDVTTLDSNDTVNLSLLDRPELGCTFSKLRAWTLTQFDKCVFLDADTLVLQNVDDLFEREELSAVADIGWPDCFNSGVFVFKPSQTTYAGLLKHADKFGSFDGGDQGLLNEFFSDWSTKDISRHLPFTYNTVSSAVYSYAPAFKRYGKDVKIVHFLGAVKPWHHYYNKETGQVVKMASSHFSTSDQIFTQMWWDLYNVSMASKNAPPSWDHWSQARQQAEKSYSDRKAEWENGKPDYKGEDRFDNILTYMSAMMLSTQPPTQPKEVSKSLPDVTTKPE